MYRQPRFFAVLALIVFGLMLAAPATGSAQTTRVKKLDLNTATQAELEGLKGIGPALAAKIIAARPFKTVADLKNVSGISEATYDAVKGQVTVRAARAVAQTAGTKAKATTEKAVQTTETKAKTETKAATERATQAAAPVSAVGRINLNTATQAELEGLKGIGPALAAKIIAARPFKTVADLKNVSGISQATYDAVKGQVTVRTPKVAAEAREAKAKAGSETAAAVQEEEAVQPKLKPGETININTATQEQLEALLGIGPVKAQAIIAGRPYAQIEDIMKVKGIKEKTFAKIKDYIVVK
ncbi:MAG: helix-hairpin-helix domain-containing protein [Candidatus Aminicenantales bacterium]|jgi:competence protein ComEA